MVFSQKNILSLTIIFVLLSSLSAFGQNEAKYPHTGVRSIKIRALINEDVYINRISEITDTTLLLKPIGNTLLRIKSMKTAKQAVRETYQHWRYGITGGIAMRIATIPSSKLSVDAVERKKNLRNGFYLNADVGYFVSENVGFGIKYDLFKSSNSMDKFTGTLPYYADFNGKISDNVSIHYISPSLMLRSVSNNRMIQTYCDLSLGYTIYYNRNKLNDDIYKIKGNNFGFSSTVGIDFMLNKKRNSSVGINFGIIATSIKEYNINGNNFHLNRGDAENISRVTFGINFRIHK